MSQSTVDPTHKDTKKKLYFGFSAQQILTFIALLILFMLVKSCFTSQDKPELKYEVLNQDILKPHKVAYDVVIEVPSSGLPNEKQLTEISNVLATKAGKVERVFVTFYLPGMEIGAGAFATAHHDPSISVVIYKNFLEQYPPYHKYIPELKSSWQHDFVIEGKTAQFK